MIAIARRRHAESAALVRRVIEVLRARYGEPQPNHPQSPVDELVATILSQHTSDINTERAFASLKLAYPNWDAVIDAPTAEIASAIRNGGLADLKAGRIREVLSEIRRRTGRVDLEFLAELPLGEAREWLESLYGVGPKTASCVLLFSLGRPAMPVDTHVHRVTRRLGIVPDRTTAEQAQPILENLIDPSEIYAAHMLLIQHGRVTCRAQRPRCDACVLVQCCPTAARSRSTERDDDDRQPH